MKVKFTGEYHFTPPENRGVTFHYLPSDEVFTVRRVCGEGAVAAGVAVEIKDSANAAPESDDASQGPAARAGDE